MVWKSATRDSSSATNYHRARPVLFQEAFRRLSRSEAIQCTRDEMDSCDWRWIRIRQNSNLSSAYLLAPLRGYRNPSSVGNSTPASRDRRKMYPVILNEGAAAREGSAQSRPINTDMQASKPWSKRQQHRKLQQQRQEQQKDTYERANASFWQQIAATRREGVGAREQPALCGSLFPVEITTVGQVFSATRPREPVNTPTPFRMTLYSTRRDPP